MKTVSSWTLAMLLLLSAGCPPNTDALEADLEAALTMRDGAAALVAVEALIERRPKDPDLLADRGRALELVGQTDQAIQAYSAACMLAPTRADLALLRGAANLRGGKVSEALPDLRIASQANPDDGYAAGLYATGLIKARTAKGLVQAIPLASRWVERDPRNVGALIAMALISHQKGQITAARAYGRRARTIAPKDPLVAEMTAIVGL